MLKFVDILISVIFTNQLKTQINIAVIKTDIAND